MWNRIKRAARAFFYTPPTIIIKESSVAGDIAGFRANVPQWSNYKYLTMVKEGFKKNVIAYRCCIGISNKVATVPWILNEIGPDGSKIQVGSHEILDLLKRPNIMQSKAVFFREGMLHILIGGNLYWESAGPITGDQAGLARELFNLRPDRMQVVPGTKGVARYEHTVNGKKHPFPVDPMTQKCNIRHLLLTDPEDDYYGMPPLRSVAREVDIQDHSKAWIFYLLENSARPGLHISFPEGSPITDDQIKILKKEIDEKFTGPEKTGKSLVTAKGGKVEIIGFSPTDMELIENLHITGRMIANAYDYPAMLLNIPGENKYANMHEANLGLWQGPITFYLGMIKDELNAWLVSRWAERENRKLELIPDMSETPIAKAKEEAGLAKLEKTRGTAALGERRLMAGLPKEVPEDDILFVPAGDIPLEMALMDEEELTDDEKQDLVRGLENKLLKRGYKPEEAKAAARGMMEGMATADAPGGNGDGSDA